MYSFPRPFISVSSVPLVCMKFLSDQAADQFSVIQHIFHTLKNVFLFEIEFLSVSICVSPAAALLSLNILTYDSFILIIALSLLQKRGCCLLSLWTLFYFYWNKYTWGLWVTKENH